MTEENMEVTGTVDVGRMVTALQDTVRDADWYYERTERAFEARHCLWEGQSEDGRKHSEDLGREAFPWDGASDIRERTIDEIVNEQVMVMWQAFSRGRMQTAGLETTDLAWGQKMSAFMRYLLTNRMRTQVRRELCLAANWRQAYGASITAVMWDQKLRRLEQEVTVEGVAALLAMQAGAQEMDERVAGEMQARAAEMVVDELREEQVAELLMQVSSLLTLSQARRRARELRETGRTVVDVPEVVQALPKWTALLPMVDVFFPVETDDIQSAPWVAHRERISESELRDRVNTAGYDEAWVEEAVKQKGKTVASLDNGRLLLSERRRNMFGVWVADPNTIEIFHFYHRHVGADGLPEVTCTVVCLGVPDKVAKRSPLPYDHGEYPYVVHQREHAQRTILESRGVAEIAETWQRDIKVQQDARTDRTQLTVLPPLVVPPSVRGHLQGGVVNARLPIMPGSQVGGRKGEEWSFMRMPPYDPGSIEIEKSQKARVDRYFGRSSETVPQDVTQQHVQDLADGWLTEVQSVAVQTLQLCQQYMTDAEVTRITGALPRPFQMTAAEIRGQFDLVIQFDARDMNAELLRQKLELLNTMVLANDRYGRVDMSKWIEVTLAAVDPWLAETTLVPMEEATNKQVADQLDRLNKMLVGIEPPMVPMPGMNYQLRMQVMQQTISANPAMQQRIAGQPDTAALIENEMKFLQFQMQQGENAQIGRVGTQSLMG